MYFTGQRRAYEQPGGIKREDALIGRLFYSLIPSLLSSLALYASVGLIKPGSFQSVEMDTGNCYL